MEQLLASCDIFNKYKLICITTCTFFLVFKSLIIWCRVPDGLPSELRKLMMTLFDWWLTGTTVGKGSYSSTTMVCTCDESFFILSINARVSGKRMTWEKQLAVTDNAVISFESNFCFNLLLLTVIINHIKDIKNKPQGWCRI